MAPAGASTTLPMAAVAAVVAPAAAEPAAAQSMAAAPVISARRAAIRRVSIRNVFPLDLAPAAATRQGGVPEASEEIVGALDRHLGTPPVAPGLHCLPPARTSAEQQVEELSRGGAGPIYPLSGPLHTAIEQGERYDHAAVAGDHDRRLADRALRPLQRGRQAGGHPGQRRRAHVLWAPRQPASRGHRSGGRADRAGGRLRVGRQVTT